MNSRNRLILFAHQISHRSSKLFISLLVKVSRFTRACLIIRFNFFCTRNLLAENDVSVMIYLVLSFCVNLNENLSVLSLHEGHNCITSVLVLAAVRPFLE